MSGAGHTRAERAAAAVAAMAVMFPRAAIAFLVALTGLSAIAVIDFFLRGLGLLIGMLRRPEAAEA